ncbi:DNA cytosine methyltransferase [Streptomyces sp. HC307]|uniref:DNA cytosine methyltransferase n=1 Tax=Streptomyces flavusporus TaxID=3385496 RepID=UPI0039172B30
MGDGRPNFKKFKPYAAATRAPPRADRPDRPQGRTTAEPLTTVATKPHHPLVIPAPTVDDCTLQMLTVEELQLVQRFPADYIIQGNQTEAILQIGNAVSVNAARWLGERLLPSLALAA